MSDSDSGGGVPLIDPEFKGQKKRKRDDAETRNAKKNRRSKKPNDIREDDLDEELGINLAIGRMGEQILVDYIARRTRKFEPDLSTVELDELYLPARNVVDTSSFEPPRTMDNLPAFLRQFSSPKEKLDEAVNSDTGSPHTIVVTGAGIRAADLTRPLRVFQSKSGKVAKLFAKHIKLKEAIQECHQNNLSVGVGTPQRIFDLLSDGALSTRHLKRIIVDASYIDQKKRGILDMKETQVPLIRLLTRKDLRERYEEGGKDALLLLFY